MSNILTRARAQLKLRLLAQGKDIETVSVDEIPDTWQNFGTKGDEWIRVDFPENENCSGCIYVGQEGSLFDPHTHKGAVEHMTVINPGGEIEVITDTWVKTVKYPDSVVIEKGTPHGVIFKKKTRILVMWHPKFEKGWNGDFNK